jgi:hypothetical protein
LGYPIQGVETLSSFSTILPPRPSARQTVALATQSPPSSDSAHVAKTAALLKLIVETASSIPTVDRARVVGLHGPRHASG